MKTILALVIALQLQGSFIKYYVSSQREVRLNNLDYFISERHDYDFGLVDTYFIVLDRKE